MEDVDVEAWVEIYEEKMAVLKSLTDVEYCSNLDTRPMFVMTCQKTSFLIYQHSKQHTLRFHHGVLRVNFADYRLAISSVVASSIYIVCGSDGCYWEYDSIESEDFVDDFAENECL